MSPIEIPLIDDQKYDELVEEIRTRIACYVPEWEWADSADPGISLYDLIIIAYRSHFLVFESPDALRRVTRATLPGVVMQAIRGKPQAAPKFKSKKKVARLISLDKKMLRAAEKKARQENNEVGGSFDRLVEVLIWNYLDCDPQFIED